MSNPYHLMICSQSGSGKPVLEAQLRAQGIPYLSGPLHVDGPEEFFAANHDKSTELDAAEFGDRDWAKLHDVVLDVTGESKSRAELLVLYKTLPAGIRALAEEWGLKDTVVGDEIYRYLEAQQAS